MEMYGEDHPHEWFKCLRGFLMEDRQVGVLQEPGTMATEVTLKELGHMSRERAFSRMEQMHLPRPYQLRQTEKFSTGMVQPNLKCSQEPRPDTKWSFLEFSFQINKIQILDLHLKRLTITGTFLLFRKPQAGVLSHQVAPKVPAGKEPQQLHDQEDPDEGQVSASGRGQPS